MATFMIEVSACRQKSKQPILKSGQCLWTQSRVIYCKNEKQDPKNFDKNFKCDAFSQFFSLFSLCLHVILYMSMCAILIFVYFS